MWKKLKLVLAVLAVVLLPLGRIAEWSEDGVQCRSCLAWAGQRVSPYHAEDNALSRWVREDLKYAPRSDTWSQTAGGPFWCPWVAGTPSGNWLRVRNLYHTNSS